MILQDNTQEKKVLNTVTNLRVEFFKAFREVKSEFMDLSIENKIIKNKIGFFPYGSGLLCEDKDTLPQNGIMILGQDFGTLKYLTGEKGILNKGEDKNPTYSTLNKFFEKDLKEKIFLTNLFMGLRIEEGMTGVNPEWKQFLKKLKIEKYTNQYIDACFKFFKKQIEIINPRLIVVLGTKPYHAMQYEFESLNKFNSFKEYKIDVENFLEGHKKIKVIVVPHPSMWNSNLKKSGITPETILIKIRKALE